MCYYQHTGEEERHSTGDTIEKKNQKNNKKKLDLSKLTTLVLKKKEEKNVPIQKNENLAAEENFPSGKKAISTLAETVQAKKKHKKRKKKSKYSSLTPTPAHGY